MGYKYKVNHSYFDYIDTEYKAYILGFIYADGSISQPKGNRQLRLSIVLQEDDGYILNKLAREVAGREVSVFYPPSIAKKGWKKRASVTIISDTLVKRLIDYGCKIKKTSLGVIFPELKEEFIPHFIRGYIDGNGSILLKKIKYTYKRKTNWNISNSHIQRYKLRIAICSTDLVFLRTLLNHLPINSHYIRGVTKQETTYTAWIETSKEVTKCIDYLYKNANYFLTRKYTKVTEFNKTIKSQAASTLVEGLETT